MPSHNPGINKIPAVIRSVLIDTRVVYLKLLKILIPAIIGVKLIQEVGGVEVVAGLLSPLMQPLDLPAVLSIVWATTVFTNIYAGLVVYFSLGVSESMTVAQVTALGALMLLSHSIPVEGAVAKRLGVPWWSTLLLRVGGAYLFAGLLVVTARTVGFWQQPASELFQLVAEGTTTLHWFFEQARALLMIFCIIFSLLLLLEAIRYIRVDRLLHRIMSPLIVFIGVKSGAGNQQLSQMTLVGLTMGLTFGAGLLISQRDNEEITERESRVVGNFLGVCHGLVDDTLLILIIGAKLSGILFCRIIFSLLLIALMTRLTDAAAAIALKWRASA